MTARDVLYKQDCQRTLEYCGVLCCKLQVVPTYKQQDRWPTHLRAAKQGVHGLPIAIAKFCWQRGRGGPIVKERYYYMEREENKKKSGHHRHRSHCSGQWHKAWDSHLYAVKTPCGMFHLRDVDACRFLYAGSETWRARRESLPLDYTDTALPNAGRRGDSYTSSTPYSAWRRGTDSARFV